MNAELLELLTQQLMEMRLDGIIYKNDEYRQSVQASSPIAKRYTGWMCDSSRGI